MKQQHGYRIHLAILLLALSSSAIDAKAWVKELAPGVTYIQIVRTSEDAAVPRIINVLKIDPRVPGVEIRSVLANDMVNDRDATRGRETMGSIARRLNATAVINTDFCNWTGDPLGLHIERGELVSEPYRRRTMFGMTGDAQYIFDVLGWDAKVTLPDGTSRAIDGIDRDREGWELIAYTSKWFTSTCTDGNGSEAVITTRDLPVRLGVPIKGKVTKHRPDLGDTPVPADGIVLSGAGPAGDFIENTLKEGMEVTVEFNVIPTSTQGWEKVVEAAGGTPRLVRNGEVCTDFLNEGVAAGFVTTTHPRSAIGATQDGRLVLVTVDGRQYNATGMSLPDLGRLMKSLGCVDALNLDGGGSSTMATYFGVLNSPSDGRLRALPNGMAIFAPDLTFPAPSFGVRWLDTALPSGGLTGRPVEGRQAAESESGVEPPHSEGGLQIVSGESMQLALIDTTTGEPLKKIVANRAIWSTAAAMGFVDQSGRFTAYGVGKVEVVVKLGLRMARTTIETVPGPPKKVLTSLDPDKSGGSNRSILSITVDDKNWNALQGVSLQVAVTGGKLDRTDIVTGDAGKVTVGITWDAPSGGQASVSCADLPPILVTREK